MKKYSMILILFIGYLIGNNIVLAQQADVIAIKNELNKWMRAYNQKDLNNAVSIFAENYIGFYAGHEDQTVNSIKDQYEKVFKNKYLKATFSMEVIEIETSGDLAYVSVKQKWAFKPSISDKAQFAYEKSILIMKKQKDGNWKIIRSSTFAVNVQK